MPNIIAKKLNLTLDTKKATPQTVKDFVAVAGDSIEITVNLTEDGLPKDITGAVTCRLIGVKSSGEYFEQTENITVSDALNGVVKIKPRLNIFNVEGRTVCGLILEDEDEAINIQRFVLNVINSLERDIVQESKDDIETLKRLNDLLNEYETDIGAFSVKLNEIGASLTGLEESVSNTILTSNTKVDESISQANEKINSTLLNANSTINTNLQGLNTKVDNEILQANEKFTNLNVVIDEEFTEIEDRLNGVNNTINTQLSKIIKLSPVDIVGSSFMYFASEVINESAESLLKKSYMLHISGVLDSTTYNSSNVLANFFKQNGKVYINTVVLSDRMVNSRSIAPSIIFDNFTNEILPTATGFKLLVRSNITKALNTENTTRCCFTPLSM